MKIMESAIDRRTFIAGLGAAAAAAMFPFPSLASDPEPLNVVLIIADNIGWTDLGCYGDPNAISPNLDRMAEEGVRFSNAFVTAASCSPSRASIISGCAPHSVNVRGLTHLYPQHQMPASTPTLPGLLSAAGYKTAMAGKWHVSPYMPVSAFGYQRSLSRNHIHDMDEINAFVTENRSNPFFIELNYMQTHRPASPGKSHEFTPHPDYPVDPDGIELPEYWELPDWPDIRRDAAGYYSQLAWMDALIGELMDCIEARGLAERTLLLFISDNGPIIPGGIGTCYDLGIAVPMIMRLPGSLPSGVTVDGLVSAIDIMPTCLDACGLAAPDSVQGASLLPLARGRADSVHDAVFAGMDYHVEYTPMRAIRTRGHKYIENLNDTPVGLDMCAGFEWAQKVAEFEDQKCCRPRPPEELYDLDADPFENRNLADDPALGELKAGLVEQLHAWRRATADPLLL